MPVGKRTEEWTREVGRRLRETRIAAGFTSARQFAAELGVKENTYTNWERGVRLIEPEDLAKVRDLTGVTCEFIYYGEPVSLPPSLARALKLG